jgi:hypothetical protein
VHRAPFAFLPLQRVLRWSASVCLLHLLWSATLRFFEVVVLETAVAALRFFGAIVTVVLRSKIVDNVEMLEKL